jgi:nucleoid DNA-binding protein
MGHVQKGATYGRKLSMLESYKDYAKKDVVSKAIYASVIQAISEQLMLELLEGNEVYLPSKLGSLQIVKYKPKRQIIDVHSSLQYNKKLCYTNNHSDGYSVRLHWDKFTSHANFKNKSMWSFNLTKDNTSRNKLSIARHVKVNGVHNFVERHKYGKI